MRALLPALLLPVLLHAAAPTAAQRHNSNAPIDVAANSIELQDRANRAVFSGSVQIKQADLRLDAQRVTLAYTGQVLDGSPQVSRVDASGGVTVRRPDQTARSSYAVYDLNRRIITMLGAVTLNQGANTVNGGRLTINLDTGRAVIDGSSVGSGGASGTTTPDGVTRTPGRVTGTFSVPKR